MNKAQVLAKACQKSWREHEAMWVIGCIDANGAITATPTRGCRAHRPEESKGKRWRWCVWSQEMMWAPGRTIEEVNNPRLHELTYDELFAIWDWLAKRGYTDNKSMPKKEIGNP